MDEERRMYILYKVTDDFQVLFGQGSNLNTISLDGPPIYDNRSADKVKELLNKGQLQDNLVSVIVNFIEKPIFRKSVWTPDNLLYEIYEFGNNTPIFRGRFKIFFDKEKSQVEEKPKKKSFFDKLFRS